MRRRTCSRSRTVAARSSRSRTGRSRWLAGSSSRMQRSHGGADVIYQATFLRRSSGARRLPAPHRPAERPGRLLLRRRRHQARAQDEGGSAAADGRLRSASRADPGASARVAHRRHRRPAGASVPLRGRRGVRTSRDGGSALRGGRPETHVAGAGVALCPMPLGGHLSGEWRAADHLSLVAFMRTDHRELLEQAGITTVLALASSDPHDLPTTIGAPSRHRLQAQAALQIKERSTGTPCYQLLDPVPKPPPGEGFAELGLLRLPEPSAGDVYLDFEATPTPRAAKDGSTSPDSGIAPATSRPGGRTPPTRSASSLRLSSLTWWVASTPTPRCTSTTTRPTRRRLWCD